MKLLADNLDIILENEGFSRVYSDIKNAIASSNVGTEDGGFATNSWLAGLIASRGSSEGKMASAVAALESNTLDPKSKEYRDAVRTKIAFTTLHRYGMVKRDETGRYTFPSSQPKDSRKRELLSQFRNFLSSGFNSDKVAADPAKSFRDAKGEVSSEWAASLPADKKKLLDAYSQLTTTSFGLLQSFYKVKGASEVAAFRHRLNTAKFSESADLQLLRKLGFVGENNLLNRGMVQKFSQFLRDPDGTGAPNGFARLMPFNNDLSYFIKRSTADKALARNASGRELDHLYRDDETAQTPDEMNPEEQRAINSRISDIEGGTKNSTRNARAKDQSSNFASMVDKAFS